MRNFLFSVLIVAVGMCGAAAQGPAAQAPPQFPTGPDIPVNIKPYYLALFLRAPGAASEPAPELMQGHLAYIHKQVDAGRYVVVGPLLDHDRIGGIAVIQAASLEEAQTITNGDPMVASGRMTIEVHPVMLEDLSSVKAVYPPAQK